MSAAWALQQAVYATLSVDSAVAALVGSAIFDAVPRDGDFPRIVIGEGQELDWSTATDEGSEHRFLVTVWSRKEGHGEAKQIATAIQDALHEAELTVTGQSLISLRHLSTDFARERDGKTWRATLKFRAVLEPNA